VPIDQVKANVPVWQRTIWPDPSDSLFAELFPAAAESAALVEALP
jgi:molybdopterin synthase catalytic subunit